MMRCAVIRRTVARVNIHGTLVPQYEHRVVVLTEGQTEDMDDHASRRWLWPWVGEGGWHLMEFTDVLHQDEPGPKVGDGTPDAALAIGEDAFRAGVEYVWNEYHVEQTPHAGTMEQAQSDGWSDYDPPEHIKELS